MAQVCQAFGEAPMWPMWCHTQLGGAAPLSTMPCVMPVVSFRLYSVPVLPRGPTNSMLFPSILRRYGFRVLERQYGTAKFGAFAAICTGLANAIQYGLQFTPLVTEPGANATGPYAFIFACLVRCFSVGGAEIRNDSSVHAAAHSLVGNPSPNCNFS